MSRQLIETLESALANLAQEASKDASVMVQFAAGDWAKIKASLAAARVALDAPLPGPPVAAPAAEQVLAAAADAEPSSPTPAAADPDDIQGVIP